MSGNIKRRNKCCQTTTFVSVPLSGREEVLQQSGPNGNTDFVYAPGYGLLYQVNGDGLTVYHHDIHGHTVALTRSDQSIVTLLQYDPYGRRVVRLGLTAVDPQVYPFLCNGGLGVMTEPTELIYMRVRYYHPNMRRFLNPDPIGDEGGYNHYMFANGNPLLWADPSGLGGEIFLGIDLDAGWLADWAGGGGFVINTSNFWESGVYGNVGAGIGYTIGYGAELGYAPNGVSGVTTNFDVNIGSASFEVAFDAKALERWDVEFSAVSLAVGPGVGGSITDEGTAKYTISDLWSDIHNAWHGYCGK